MKKLFMLVLAASALAACGGGNDGKKMAKDVCDCYSKANAMDPADPGRAKAQADCVTKQGEAWGKIKDDQKQSDAFNAELGECMKQLLK